MRFWQKRVKGKEGFMSILIMLIVSSILPLFLFSLVEINYLYAIKDKAQWVNDHVANSAIRSVNQEALSTGTIEIVEDEALERGKAVFQASYHLEDDLTVQPHSILKENPALKVYVLNEDMIGTDFVTEEGETFHISRPSVIVYSSIQPTGLFFNRLVTLQSYSMYEIDNDKYQSIDGQNVAQASKNQRITTASSTIKTSFVPSVNEVLSKSFVQTSYADSNHSAVSAIKGNGKVKDKTNNGNGNGNNQTNNGNGNGNNQNHQNNTSTTNTPTDSTTPTPTVPSPVQPTKPKKPIKVQELHFGKVELNDKHHP